MNFSAERRSFPQKSDEIGNAALWLIDGTSDANGRRRPKSRHFRVHGRSLTLAVTDETVSNRLPGRYRGKNLYRERVRRGSAAPDAQKSYGEISRKTRRFAPTRDSKIGT